ncbi:hypothetical protein BDA96_02G363000 [Sorghum bicolor]|uniref:Uncharacterized protein n=1 Tax=Sorghum bicolor TaxID=4558 RepID=A0A921UUU6_SORBI|nr:hypothetical protein BDA96_02G363000 [Sorghum bicolor]
MMRIRFQQRHGFHKPPRPNGSMPFHPRSETADRHAAPRVLHSTARRFSVASSVHEISPPLLSATGGDQLRRTPSWLVASPFLQVSSEANDGQQ